MPASTHNIRTLLDLQFDRLVKAVSTNSEAVLEPDAIRVLLEWERVKRDDNLKEFITTVCQFVNECIEFPGQNTRELADELYADAKTKFGIEYTHKNLAAEAASELSPDTEAELKAKIAAAMASRANPASVAPATTPAAEQNVLGFTESELNQ